MTKKNQAKNQAPAQPETDAVLATAAATAQPDQQPAVDPQPPQVASNAPVGVDEEHAPLRPVFSLEEARGLSEIEGDVYTPFETANESAILSFKDTDGRTMRVAATVGGLAKIAVVK